MLSNLWDYIYILYFGKKYFWTLTLNKCFNHERIISFCETTWNKMPKNLKLLRTGKGMQKETSWTDLVI